MASLTLRLPRVYTGLTFIRLVTKLACKLEHPQWWNWYGNMKFHLELQLHSIPLVIKKLQFISNSLLCIPELIQPH